MGHFWCTWYAIQLYNIVRSRRLLLNFCILFMISQDPKISQDLIRFLYFPDGFVPPLHCLWLEYKGVLLGFSCVSWFPDFLNLQIWRFKLFQIAWFLFPDFYIFQMALLHCLRQWSGCWLKWRWPIVGTRSRKSNPDLSHGGLGRGWRVFFLLANRL